VNTEADEDPVGTLHVSHRADGTIVTPDD